MKYSTQYIHILSLLAGLLLWQLAVWIFNPPTFLVSSPLQVFTEIITRPLFYLTQTWFTIGSAFLGYIIAIVISFVLASIFVQSKQTEKILYPYLIIIKTTPIIAVAPLIMIWLGFGFFSHLLIIISVSFFPILVATLTGLRSTDTKSLDVFRSLSATPQQILFKLQFPNALPYIFPALKVSLLLAITGAFVSEFIASTQGLGHTILVSMRTFQSIELFTALTITTIIGFTCFMSLDWLERKIVFWQYID